MLEPGWKKRKSGPARPVAKKPERKTNNRFVHVGHSEFLVWEEEGRLTIFPQGGGACEFTRGFLELSGNAETRRAQAEILRKLLKTLTEE